MVKVDLKGVAKVSAKGRTYYYAWRGGPPLRGERGSPEFLASYNEAHEGLREAEPGRFRALVSAYKGPGGPFKELSPSTRAHWAPWLDEISAHFGSLSIAQFDRLARIRKVIRAWLNRLRTKPRTHDYAKQVLSRVLAFGVETGKLDANPCEGIANLYEGSRADIIWTPDALDRIKAKCSAEIAWAVDLAAHTGLRLGDLVRVSWSHIGEDAIIIRTGKSRGKREAIVPLYDGLRALLAAIPKRATTILTSSHERPWTADGFGSSFNKAKIAAGMAKLDLHFNDLRGTAATKFYLANIPIRVIAEIMGWEEESVEKIIRRYVDRKAATRALIHQINGAR